MSALAERCDGLTGGPTRSLSMAPTSEFAMGLGSLFPVSIANSCTPPEPLGKLTRVSETPQPLVIAANNAS